MKLFAASGLFLLLFLQDSYGPQTGYNFDGDASFFRLYEGQHVQNAGALSAAGPAVLS